MDKIKWCLKQGMKLVEPNKRLAQGYLKMAEGSLGTMNREKNENVVFSISAGYYVMYYSLYAVMQTIGVKCEIHACSIEFMKRFLKEFYSEEDIGLIETAFSARNVLQYYVDKNVNKSDMEKVWSFAYDFFVKSREIAVKLDEGKIIKLRGLLK